MSARKTSPNRWKVTTRRRDWAMVLRVAEILRESEGWSRRSIVRKALILLNDEHVIIRDADTRERSQ